jgi:hypothetical protein
MSARHKDNFTAADKAYYKETWKQDIVALSECPEPVASDPDCKHYRLETCFPLLHDPDLPKEICARTEVGLEGKNKLLNRIVFRECKGGKEGTVDCTHVAVYTAPVESAEEIATATPEELAVSSENLPEIKLPPLEHFGALQSYVAAIADMGIHKMFDAARAKSVEAASMPFGFNPAMQSQILRALTAVKPESGTSLKFMQGEQYLEHGLGRLAPQALDLDNAIGLFETISDEQFVRSLLPELGVVAIALPAASIKYYLDKAEQHLPSAKNDFRGATNEWIDATHAVLKHLDLWSPVAERILGQAQLLTKLPVSA